MPRENTQFKSGAPGRPKGSKNKVGVELKEMIANALSNVGGVEYLELQAQKNPTAFLSLVAKILPKQVDAQISVNGKAEYLERLRRGRDRINPKQLLACENTHTSSGEMIPANFLDEQKDEISFI